MSLAQPPTARASSSHLPLGKLRGTSLFHGAVAAIAPVTPSSISKRGRGLEHEHADTPPSSKRKAETFSPPPTFGHSVSFTMSGKISRSLSQEQYRATVREHLAANQSSSDAGWLSERVKSFDVSHYHYIVDVDCITVASILNEAGQHARGQRKRKLAREDELMRESILKANAEVLEDVRDDLKVARDDLKVATSEVASLTSKVGRRDATLKVYDRALDVRKATEECIRDVELLRVMVRGSLANVYHPDLAALKWRTFAIIAYELAARACNLPLFPGRYDKKTGRWIMPQGIPRGSQSGFETILRAALLQLPPWIIKASSHAVLVYDELKEERHSSAHPDFNQEHAERYSLQRKHPSPFQLSYVEHQQKIHESLRTFIDRDPLQPWKPKQLALEPLDCNILAAELKVLKRKHHVELMQMFGKLGGDDSKVEGMIKIEGMKGV